MDDDIRPKLQAIVDKEPKKYRKQSQQKIDALLDAGLNSYESLLLAVQNPETDIKLRSTICRVLGQLGKKSATRALLNLFKDETASTLHQQAFLSISFLRSRTATLPLVKIMKEDKDAYNRQMAAYTLSPVMDERAITGLIEVLENQSEEPTVRGQAAESLARVTDARAITALLNALNDTNVEVRFWSAFALGQMGDPQALPTLEHLASTDNAELPRWWSVSKEATNAIERIKAKM